LKAGRSFATNGPMLFLSADGQEPGSELRGEAPRKVRLRVEALSPRPLERLEIIADGRVVHSVTHPDSDRRWIAEIEHTFTHDGWVVARCFEPALGTIRFAHTSPVYVDVGRPAPVVEDARFFLEWIDREIRFYTAETGFRDPRHREELLDFFRTARRVYARLAE
jgi:TolB protein